MFSFKKATEVISNWPFWIMFAMAAAGAILIIVKVANVSVAEASKIPEDLEEELLLASRFYNSEGCFAYEEVLAGRTRVHTRVIDADKFTQQNMDDKCFLISKVKYAFSLSLEPDFGLDTLDTFNWEGEFATKTIEEDVFVLHDDTKSNAKLIIRIQNVG